MKWLIIVVFIQILLFGVGVASSIMLTAWIYGNTVANEAALGFSLLFIALFSCDLVLWNTLSRLGE